MLCIMWPLFYRTVWTLFQLRKLNSPALSDVNKTQPSLQTLEMWMEGRRDSVRVSGSASFPRHPDWGSPVNAWLNVLWEHQECHSMSGIRTQVKLNLLPLADSILIFVLFFVFHQVLFPEPTISKYIAPNWSINWVLSKQISDSMNIN